MPKTIVNRWRDLDIELEYDSFGDPSDPTILLVTGFGGQMIMWAPDFCSMLAERGRHVVRFDNRDVGLSTKLDGVTVDIAAYMAVEIGADPADLPPPPYTLSGFAEDICGLLDALEVDAAHVVGHSMGGMIVQTMAIEHPKRVLTMTSIASTTGEAGYGPSTPEARSALLNRPATGREAVIEQSVHRGSILGTARYFDEDEARRLATDVYDRSYYPEGVTRHLAAVHGSGHRADGLCDLEVPTLVIHGTADPIIGVSGGQRTAELVPGARLVLIDGMAHDLPRPLWPRILDPIVEHTNSRRA